MKLSELPESARTKFGRLELNMMSAEDASRACQQRINTLTNGDQQMVEQLAADRDQYADKHRSLSMLFNRLRQWITELHGNVTLELAPPVTVELDDDEKLTDVLAHTRSEIAALQDQLGRVRITPLPKADAKELAEQFVVEMAAKGRPAVSIVNDKLRVVPPGDMLAAEDTLALICWADPIAVLRRLDHEIDKRPDRSDALSAHERQRLISEIEERLLTLERCEEHLIESAAADGFEVLRRPTASPLAVLGVVIVIAQQVPAQAVA
jgi:hypothetical protein